MGRSPCCDKGVKKGPWTPEEDIALVSYIQEHGPGNWRAVPVHTGLMRCSKSCRLRWTNYLRPGIKRGNFSAYEDRMIVHLQALLGNRWAAIASYLPQRTDNDIKNYWNTHLKKRLKKMQLQHTGEMSHAELLKPPAGSGSSAAGKGQWESRLQTDIQYAKQALLEALNMGSSAAAASFSPSSCNSFQNSAQTPCNYAASVENLSRLLEGWKQSQSNSQVQPKKEEMQEFGAMNMNMNVNMDMSTTSTQSCSSSQNSETAMADVKMEDAAAAAVATAAVAWTPASAFNSAFNSPRGDGCDDGSSINELDVELGRPSAGANAGSGAGASASASATEEPEQELPLSMLEKWLMEESLQAQDRSSQHFSLTECLQDQPWQTC